MNYSFERSLSPFFFSVSFRFLGLENERALFRVYQGPITAKSVDQFLPPSTSMQRLPLLDFPIDILFLILYELPIEDLVSIASVSSIITHQVAPPLIHPRTDLQDFLLPL